MQTRSPSSKPFRFPKLRLRTLALMLLAAVPVGYVSTNAYAAACACGSECPCGVSCHCGHG